MKRVVSPAVLMAAGTVLSRATGFLRTAALATVLGLTVTADAYNAASSIPTMLLVLITGGTLSAALVPILATPDSVEGRRRAAASALLAVVALSVGGAVTMAMTAPLVADALAAAAPEADRAARAEQTELFLLLMSPQVVFLGLLVVTNGILTVDGRLGRVGATPVLNNVLAIAGVIAFASMTPDGQAPTTSALWLLGGSATLALAVAALSQLVACRALLPPPRDLLGAAERRVLRRLVAVGRWSILYVVTNQVALFVVFVVAGRATGAVSAYQWSFAIMQLPYAILAVPILAATLPKLTVVRDDPGRSADITRAARTLLVLGLVPAALGLVIFGDVAAALLLGTGSPEQVAELAGGVRWFALALLPFTFFQLYVRLCYVLERNAWPALVNLAVNATLVAAAGAALSVPRSAVLDVLGLGYALSYVVGAVALGVLLARQGRDVLHLAPGMLRAVLWVGSGAALAVLSRELIESPWGLVTAVAGYSSCAAVALWPWRRTRLVPAPRT